MVNLLVLGRVVRVAGAVRLVDTKNIVLSVAAVTLTMVLAGVKEDIS
jgi:hypothetical protein